MSLKLNIDSIEELDEGVAALYKKTDNGYTLDVEGAVSKSELDRLEEKRRIEAEHRKTAETRASEHERALQELRDKSLKDGGKWEELEQAHKAREAEIEEKYQKQIQDRDNALLDSTKSSVVSRIASDIGKHPKALEPHLEKRISVEMVDGKPKPVYLDETGKPSTLTEKEFLESFSGIDYLADLVVGSKASGGGAGGSGDGGGASLNSKTKLDLTKASPKEGVAALKAKLATA